MTGQWDNKLIVPCKSGDETQLLKHRGEERGERREREKERGEHCFNNNESGHEIPRQLDEGEGKCGSGRVGGLEEKDASDAR